MAVGMTGAVVIALGMGVLFGFGPPPPPERPKPPPPPESHMNEVLRYSRAVYQGMLEQDAKKFHIKAPTMDEMARPNPYFEEFKGKRRLKAGDPLVTPHLHLSLEVAKVRATIEGQTFGSDHQLLRIQNRTD